MPGLGAVQVGLRLTRLQVLQAVQGDLKVAMEWCVLRENGRPLCHKGVYERHAEDLLLVVGHKALAEGLLLVVGLKALITELTQTQ
jgi:hypothetical protein